MQPNFKPITLQGQDQYWDVISGCPEATSDYAFANLYGWTGGYGLEWAFDDPLVWIRQTRPETCWWAPIGQWESVDWGKVDFPDGANRFIRVPQRLKEIWKKRLPREVKAREDRDHYDYVYLVRDLVELRGNRFHKKKNLLNQFKKKYDYEFVPMDVDCVEEVLEMQAQWCEWHECESQALRDENEAISTILKSFDHVRNITGGSLKVDGRMVAYTVAEPVNKDMLVIHFEKGDTRYKGVYQAINQMFLTHLGERFTYVNREQDMGDEGLRKAKLSYNPVDFLKKYQVALA